MRTLFHDGPSGHVPEPPEKRFIINLCMKRIPYLVFFLALSASAAPNEIKWDGITNSRISDITVKSLNGLNLRKPCLVVPVIVTNSMGWRFDLYVTAIINEYAASKSLDPIACKPDDNMKTVLQDPTKRTEVKKSLMSQYKVASIVIAEYRPDLHKICFESLDKRVVADLSVDDDEWLPCVPERNRKIASWTFSKISQKVGNGECAVLILEALQAQGLRYPADSCCRLLAEDETLMPGDIVVRKTGGHHQLILYNSSPQSDETLNQNTMWGKEEGRKVSWNHVGDRTKNNLWRPRQPVAVEPEASTPKKPSLKAQSSPGRKLKGK